MFRKTKRYFRSHFGKNKKFYSVIRELLGIIPDNIEIYKLALIHRSASVTMPDGTSANNERLEFLGDAILEAIVSDFLFVEYPDQTEGFLTRFRSRIVSRSTLDDIACGIGINDAIIANFNGAYSNKHLSGNALEALIGAIYLDKGYDFANRFVISFMLKNHIDFNATIETDRDFKSRLIEWCQKSKRTIHFRTVHDVDSTVQHPTFISTIVIDGIDMGHGTGGSKKEAEQIASYAVSLIVSDEISDYFLETLDSTLETGRESLCDERDGEAN